MFLLVSNLANLYSQEEGQRETSTISVIDCLIKGVLYIWRGHSLSIHGRGMREPETGIDRSEFPTSFLYIQLVLQ